MILVRFSGHFTTARSALAEAYPELVCNLHRGLCEGVVDQVGGGRVEEFATLYDPEPCHVTVSVGYAEDRT